MKMMKVSIIVPVYNAERTLEKCLNSLVHRSYEDIEILLINDGSTDDSEKICRGYAEEYNYIKLLSQTNSGPATARNNGIEHSTGEYVAFVDADDFVEPDFVELMALSAEQSGADVVICSYYEESETGNRVHRYRYQEGLYESDAVRDMAVSLISDVSENRIPPYSWVRMVRRDIFDLPGMRYSDGMIRSEDYFLYTQLHFQINKVYIFAEKPLYHYIENNLSVTHSYVKNYWESVLEIYDGLKSKLPKQEAIEKNLNIMIIQRSMIALNNAARANNDRVFKSEVNEITRDKHLNNAIKSLSLKEGYKEFGPYFLLMRLKLRKFVYLRYNAKRDS